MSADDEFLRTGVDDESFHPLGQEWEDELEEMLDDTEYDTDLGLAMAEDAMRVTKGELSDAEFHAKYHEQVLEEFGVDDRPTAEAYEEMQAEAEAGGSGLAGALENFDGDGDMDRREVMKKMGIGAAALGLGGFASANSGEPEFAAAEGGEDDDEEGTQWGMVIDLERCDGCLECVQGCEEENGWDAGMNWMYVMAWEDETNPAPEAADTSPGEFNYLVRPCQHCTDAPCEKVCPTTARHTRSKDGLVLTDYDVCIGCRYCQVACPYGVNYFQWDEPNVSEQEIQEATEGEHIYADYSEEGESEDPRRVDSRAPRGTMSKCTMCPTRQDGNMGEDSVGTAACEDACANAGMHAIHFGDMNDPESKPNRYLRMRTEQDNEDGDRLEVGGDEDGEDAPDWYNTSTANGNLSTFRLFEDVGTNPNVVYIGDEPGAEAHQIDADDYEFLTSYDEKEMVHQDRNHVSARKDVTDDGTVGWF